MSNNTVSALTARKNFGELLNRAYYNEEEIFIERKGKLVAKIVPLVAKKPATDILAFAGIWNKKTTEIMKRAVKKGRAGSLRNIHPL